MNNKTFIYIIVIVASWISAPASSVSAQPAGLTSIFRYFVQDDAGQIVRTGSGGCLHTIEWEPTMPDCPPAAEPVVVATAPRVVKVVVEESEFFDFDKSVLEPQAQAKLGRLAELVQRPAQFDHIRVLGYTDRIGTDAYNMGLSQRRAQAVRDYLVSHDQIPASKIEMIAMGKKDPRVACEGVHGSQALIKCLAPNRRVEVYLTFERVER